MSCIELVFFSPPKMFLQSHHCLREKDKEMKKGEKTKRKEKQMIQMIAGARKTGGGTKRGMCLEEEKNEMDRYMLMKRDGHGEIVPSLWLLQCCAGSRFITTK